MREKLVEVKFGRYGERFLVYIYWKLWRFFGLVCLKELRIGKIGLNFSRRKPFGFMLYSIGRDEIGNLSIQFWVDV